MYSGLATSAYSFHTVPYFCWSKRTKSITVAVFFLCQRMNYGKVKKGNYDWSTLSIFLIKLNTYLRSYKRSSLHAIANCQPDYPTVQSSRNISKKIIVFV